MTDYPKECSWGCGRPAVNFYDVYFNGLPGMPARKDGIMGFCATCKQTIDCAGFCGQVPLGIAHSDSHYTLTKISPP